jgi:hypothetical protein
VLKLLEKLGFFRQKDILKKASELCVERAEQGLPPPSLAEQVARKPRSRALSKISEEEVTKLLKSCTLNKKQRKKLWVKVAYEKALFDLYQRVTALARFAAMHVAFGHLTSLILATLVFNGLWPLSSSFFLSLISLYLNYQLIGLRPLIERPCSFID